MESFRNSTDMSDLTSPPEHNYLASKTGSPNAVSQGKNAQLNSAHNRMVSMYQMPHEQPIINQTPVTL